MNPDAGSRRTVSVGKRRVRLKLEQEYWAGLAEIAEREHMSVDELLAETDRRRATVALPDAVRMLCVGYFRQAATGPGNLASALDAAVGGPFSLK